MRLLGVIFDEHLKFHSHLLTISISLTIYIPWRRTWSTNGDLSKGGPHYPVHEDPYRWEWYGKVEKSRTGQVRRQKRMAKFQHVYFQIFAHFHHSRFLMTSYTRFACVICMRWLGFWEVWSWSLWRQKIERQNTSKLLSFEDWRFSNYDRRLRISNWEDVILPH